MSSPSDRFRTIALAGVSSLPGKELKSLIEDSTLVAAKIRLFDDALEDGTLTEAAGEAAFVQKIEEDSFDGAALAIFAGSEEFTTRHWQQASRAGAAIIDLSGALRDLPTAIPWIPGLDSVLPPPLPTVGKQFSAPGTPAIVATTFAAAFRQLPVSHIAFTFLRPVTEAGTEGLQELEKQTVSLLSFQSQKQDVFDAQVAFNFLAEYGDASKQKLSLVRSASTREVVRYLAGRVPIPAIQFIHAPVFYGFAFSIFVGMQKPISDAQMISALTSVGIRTTDETEGNPDNISAANEESIVISPPRRDSGMENAWWLWGVVDNIRLAARNAVQIAEKILAP